MKQKPQEARRNVDKYLFNDQEEGIYKHRNNERNHTEKGESFLICKS